MSETLYLIALILALVIIVGQTIANGILLYQVHRRNEQIKQLNEHIQMQDEKIEVLETRVDTLNNVLVTTIELQTKRVLDASQKAQLIDLKDKLTINNTIDLSKREGGLDISGGQVTTNRDIVAGDVNSTTQTK